MNPFSRSRFLLAFVATLLFAGAAWAEAIFSVNEPGSGAYVFDQPSVAAKGTFLHVAFIGDNTASGRYKLYYAGIDGSANFQSATTTRLQVVKIRPVAIDSGDPYTDARHPQIAYRSSTSTSTSLVVLFQAIPAGGSDYKLFRALLVIDNNAVRTQQVKEIVHPVAGPMAGNLVDPSFGLVTTDNTLRVAYTYSATGDVYYARAGADNAFLVGSPILLSRQPGTRGVNPLPRLRLDSSKRSHVAWAANNTSPTPSGIYYAMVKDSSTSVDNLVIGATQVLWGGYRWGFPSILFVSNVNRIVVLAADEPYGTTGIAGSLGFTVLHPDAVKQDGNPVDVNNLATNSLFFITPPGGAVLFPNFDTYRPEAAIDSQNRVNVAGYGFLGSSPLYQGTPGRYYSMGIFGVTYTTGTSSTFAAMILSPVPVGIGDLSFATEIPGDYTRPAFAHFNGKAVQFWSGPDALPPGARNLYVTGTPDAFDSSASSQSGCAVAGNPPRGEPERIPGAVALFLPAALIGFRKLARKAFAR